MVKKYEQDTADLKSFAKDIKFLSEKNYLMFKLLHDAFIGFRDAYQELQRG